MLKQAHGIYGQMSDPVMRTEVVENFGYFLTFSKWICAKRTNPRSETVGMFFLCGRKCPWSDRTSYGICRGPVETQVSVTNLSPLQVALSPSCLTRSSLLFIDFPFPVEITSEIFVHCLPTSYTDREWNTSNPSEAPTLLLHVCRIWREIAIGMPALWAKMELSMHNAHRHDTAQAWLTRAKACPLSVKLYHWARGEGDEDDTCENDWSDEEEDNFFTWSIPPFQTLLARSHNLVFLELSTISWEHIYKLDELSDSCNFPSLRKLTVGIEEGLDALSDWEDMEDDPCVRLFANVPLLCEISLIGSTRPSFSDLFRGTN
ncbi:hypothetical protein C8R45DRAFT_1173085 [Mycena sanguinolenta]|nr:hypothetical protein C8R45DRAFT_1173085 [Mycena sanguinolenta]